MSWLETHRRSRIPSKVAVDPQLLSSHTLNSFVPLTPSFSHSCKFVDLKSFVLTLL